MTENWIGKSVSIQCRGNIGIFQGTIKRVTPADIVITRVVRNGIPIKKQFFEITLTCKDIEKLEMISSTNVPNLFPGKIQQPSQSQPVNESLVGGMENLKVAKQSSTAVRNKTPPSEAKVTNGKMLAKSPGLSKQVCGPQKNGLEVGSARSTSRPIDINTSGNQSKANLSAQFKIDNLKKKSRNGNGNGNGNNSGNRYSLKNSAFGTPVDDPMMDEEFDFEKNLALFDKQAIWDEIDAIQQKPDVERQTVASAKKTYRHDENILASVPTQYRQIEIESSVTAAAKSGAAQEYVTDGGLVIPSIPRVTRNLIQQLAENHGLTMERQNDLIARATAEVAVQLLGGSRRLTPNNQHQWPKIVIVCDEPFNARLSEIGIATGRMLACHGLKVVLFVAYSSSSTRASHELELYAATGNLFTHTISVLPSSDLVITAIKSRNMNEPVRKWLTENRAPVLAIDPPAGGFDNLSVKCSILPILPLNDLGPESVTGRLYLCNLGIPDKFFIDSGIKYKSPFDKAVIPIHRRTE